MKNNLLPKRLLGLSIILLCLVGTTVSGQSSEMSKTRHYTDSTLNWNPAPEFFPNCSFTILNGDLESPNLDFLFRVEPNTDVIYHTHNSAERMILISGEMQVTFEGEESNTMKAGSYAYGPAGKPHKAKCLDKGPCILFVAMNEPFSAQPVNIKD